MEAIARVMDQDWRDEPPVVRDEKWWLDHHLENWARYMRGADLPKGMPRSASGQMTNYLIVTGDSERAYEKLDVELAEATNAAIEGLSPAEQCAIRRAYDLEAVYRFPRNNYAETLLRAKTKIRDSLRRRQVWVG